MKVIIIAGIKRSGSTWLYNVVRLLCEQQSTNIKTSGQKYMIDANADYNIIKVHPFITSLAKIADIILISDRENAGIRGSMKRAFGGDLTDKRLSKMRKDLRRWQKFADYSLWFTDIYDRPIGVIKKLSEILEIDADADVIYQEIKALKPPTDKPWDEQTFLFQNHITIKDKHR